MVSLLTAIAKIHFNATLEHIVTKTDFVLTKMRLENNAQLMILVLILQCDFIIRQSKHTVYVFKLCRKMKENLLILNTTMNLWLRLTWKDCALQAWSTVPLADVLVCLSHLIRGKYALPVQIAQPQMIMCLQNESEGITQTEINTET